MLINLFSTEIRHGDVTAQGNSLISSDLHAVQLESDVASLYLWHDWPDSVHCAWLKDFHWCYTVTSFKCWCVVYVPAVPCSTVSDLDLQTWPWPTCSIVWWNINIKSTHSYQTLQWTLELKLIWCYKELSCLMCFVKVTQLGTVIDFSCDY
jgi:hypothetical protein